MRREEGKKPGQLRLGVPNGIEVDACGLVYVPDHDNRRVQVFTPEGELAAHFRMQGDRPGEPWDVNVQGSEISVLTDNGVERYRRDGGCEG